ncbi:MAG: N-formylglutamate amidohydrolase [Ruminiclostridium sp.]
MNPKNHINPVICNIPHSGTNIPDWALQDFIIPCEKIREFAEFMADKDVDKLFSFVPEENRLTAEISRIVVDTERYRNDSDEPMAGLGMGLFYTCDHKGNTIRRQGATYEKCLMIYDKYHRELEEKTAFCLEKTGRCIILDCHSFHDGMEYTGCSTESFPDVCVGFNEKEPGEIVLKIKELFENEGYSVKLNLPFSGAILPLKYSGDNRVVSVMLELNRRIYCGSKQDFRKVSGLCEKAYWLVDG